MSGPNEVKSVSKSHMLFFVTILSCERLLTVVETLGNCSVHQQLGVSNIMPLIKKGNYRVVQINSLVRLRFVVRRKWQPHWLVFHSLPSPQPTRPQIDTREESLMSVLIRFKIKHEGVRSSRIVEK